MIRRNDGRELVLITGSSGRIGTALGRRLSKQYYVVGADLEGPPYPPEDVDWIFVDLVSDESTQQALSVVEQRYGKHIASVVHLAAYYDFSGEPSSLYNDVTIQGSKRLIRKLRKFQVDQFIFSSSILVHKPCPPGEQMNEEWEIQAKWDYPQSKVETEALLMREHGDIPLLILRIAGVYDDRCNSIPLSHQAQRIYENRLTAHVFPGDINCGQAFVHLDDCVNAFRLAIEKRKVLPPELVLLIGEDKTFTYDQLQREFAQLIHQDDAWQTTMMPKLLAKMGAWLENNVPIAEEPFIKPWMIDLADDHYELDISRAKHYLGWKPDHYLIHSLAQICKFLRENPVEFYQQNNLNFPSWLKETA